MAKLLMILFGAIAFLVLLNFATWAMVGEKYYTVPYPIATHLPTQLKVSVRSRGPRFAEILYSDSHGVLRSDRVYVRELSPTPTY